MNILCTILFYVCSSHAQTPLNDISGTNTIYSASEVDYRLASKVPTNRTITVGNQVGSLESNLVFSSSSDNVTRVYNPANSNQWVSIASNAMTIYTRSVVSNLWSYHCGVNEVSEYPGVSWAPYPQDGTFFAPAPPLESDGEIITPIVGNTEGTYFRFWWSSGIYRLSYPGNFPAVLATWETNVLHGADVDVYIRWLGDVITTNATSLQLFSKDELAAHNADTNAHSYIQLRIDALPTDADLSNTLQASKDYTHQYVLDTLNDADLATLTAVGILIGNHNTDASAHADIRASITNLPAQPSIALYNYFSTNANSTLVISASNSILRVQEVIP